jgi:hypothetical protein
VPVRSIDEMTELATPSPYPARSHRPVRRLAAVSRQQVAFFVGYLALQAVCVAGLVTLRYPDSFGYFHLSFTGKDEFPPTVPFVYAVLRTDPLRVAFQCLLATIGWWVLALAASRLTKDRRIRIGLRAVLLALGLSAPVVSWNTVILSESIAISLMALGIGLWLEFYRRPTLWRALGALVVSECWALTKPLHIIIGFGIAAFALGDAIWHRRQLLRVLVAICFIGLGGLNYAVFGSNETINLGLVSDIIQDRILPNPSYTAWFVAHGMPDSAAIDATAGGPFGTALQQIPVMADWITAHGEATYSKFVLSHPDYTLLGPLNSLAGEVPSIHEQTSPTYAGIDPNPTTSLLSPLADYGRYHQVLPGVLEDVLFERGQSGALITLALVALGACALALRRARDGRLILPAFLTVLALGYAYAVWIAGGVGELNRLAMVDAVMIRIGLWLLVGFALDSWLSRRDSSSVGEPADRTSLLWEPTAH